MNDEEAQQLMAACKAVAALANCDNMEIQAVGSDEEFDVRRFSIGRAERMAPACAEYLLRVVPVFAEMPTPLLIEFTKTMMMPLVQAAQASHVLYGAIEDIVAEQDNEGEEWKEGKSDA